MPHLQAKCAPGMLYRSCRTASVGTPEVSYYTSTPFERLVPNNTHDFGIPRIPAIACTYNSNGIFRLHSDFPFEFIM